MTLTKNPGQANQVDSWLKEVDALEGSVSKLKAILDKKKKTAKDKGAAAVAAVAKKPEVKKSDDKKPTEKVPEKPEGEPDKEDEKDTSGSSNKVWKKKSPTKTTET